jgi:exodeoxyribonuclease VII small subunit
LTRLARAVNGQGDPGNWRTLDFRQNDFWAGTLAETSADTENRAGIGALSFEDALKALEDVVRKLESGEATLDHSIALYARGDALRKHCQMRLDAAQARIEAIVADRDGNAVSTRPFDESAGE